MTTTTQHVRKVTGILTNRAAIKGRDAIVAQMADDFRVLVASSGSVDSAALELIGWTPEQIEAHGRSASRRAIAQSVRRQTAA